MGIKLRGEGGGAGFISWKMSQSAWVIDRGHDSYLADKFLKDIIPSPSYCGYHVAIWLSLLGNS